MDTIFLIPETWDMTVDYNGNIALALDPYSMVQDAASEIQTYAGEVYFDTLIGIPYQTEILGQGLPLNLYRQQAINAALRVPGVIGSQVFFAGLSTTSTPPPIPAATSIVDYATIDYAIVDNGAPIGNQNGSPGRVLTGQVQITTESGDNLALNLNLPVTSQFVLDNSQLDGFNVL